MRIREMFRGIDRVFAQTFRVVVQRVSHEQLVAGIVLVRAARWRFASPSDRRWWVAYHLMARFQVPEHHARLIVELAVAHMKDEPGRNAPEREAA